MSYRIYAMLRWRRLADSENVLGEAYKAEYETKEEAQDVRDMLAECTPECDPELVDPLTTYHVEEI